jgi:hypothetical protein
MPGVGIAFSSDVINFWGGLFQTRECSSFFFLFFCQLKTKRVGVCGACFLHQVFSQFVLPGH